MQARRILVLSAITIIPLSLVFACGSDPVVNVTPDSGNPDVGSPDVVAPDGGSPDVTPDGAAADSAADALTDGGRPPKGVRLANMRAIPLDFCIWPKGGQMPAMPMFADAGGIPPGAVSTWARYDSLSLDFSLRYTPAGSPCAADAGFNTTNQLGDTAPYRTFWTTDKGTLLGSGFFDVTQPTAGKDTVLFDRMQSSSATLQFVPDGDASAPVPITHGVPVLLTPGVSGQLVGDVPGVGTPPVRLFKSVTGGVARIFMTGNAILVCDELAPAVGVLSDCRNTVRAP